MTPASVRQCGENALAPAPLDTFERAVTPCPPVRSLRPVSWHLRAPARDGTPPQTQLGNDLWTLAASGDSSLATVTVLSRPGADGRCTFRLGFADGRTLKGRRCEGENHAERVERLCAYLDRRYFPRVLKRHASALLEEWIVGGPLAGEPEVFRRGGAILAGIHSTKLPENLRAGALSWVEGSGPRLCDGLDELVTLKALRAEEAVSARELAGANAPSGLVPGLVHGDLCAENMLIDAEGRMHVVDNESVAVHAPEYDLARTWYRWPMTAAQRAAYEDGYGRSEARTRFDAHFTFWAIVVLVESAAFRLRVGASDPEVPLGRLRPLLEQKPASVPR